MAFFEYPICKNIRVFEYVPYRREVVRYLDLITTTYVGRTLYRYIAKRIHTIEIIPFVAVPLEASTRTRKCLPLAPQGPGEAAHRASATIRQPFGS